MIGDSRTNAAYHSAVKSCRVCCYCNMDFLKSFPVYEVFASLQPKKIGVLKVLKLLSLLATGGIFGKELLSLTVCSLVW